MAGPCGLEIKGEGGLESLGEDDDFSGCGLVGYEGAVFGNWMSKVDERLSGGSGEDEGLSCTLVGSESDSYGLSSPLPGDQILVWVPKLGSSWV